MQNAFDSHSVFLKLYFLLIKKEISCLCALMFLAVFKVCSQRLWKESISGIKTYCNHFNAFLLFFPPSSAADLEEMWRNNKGDEKAQAAGREALPVVTESHANQNPPQRAILGVLTENGQCLRSCSQVKFRRGWAVLQTAI